MQGPKNRQKFATWARSHNFVGLHLRNEGTYRASEKIVKQQYSLTCPHNMVNFGLLAAEICWRVWGIPANFNGFCVLAALLHGSSGRQSNFAALSRGRHLYLAGRPSRWALATFLVCSDFLAENTRRAAALKTDCSRSRSQGVGRNSQVATSQLRNFASATAVYMQLMN